MCCKVWWSTVSAPNTCVTYCEVCLPCGFELSDPTTTHDCLLKSWSGFPGVEQPPASWPNSFWKVLVPLLWFIPLCPWRETTEMCRCATISALIVGTQRWPTPLSSPHHCDHWRTRGIPAFCPVPGPPSQDREDWQLGEGWRDNRTVSTHTDQPPWLFYYEIGVILCVLLLDWA